ncbi:MAG: tyrosine--tRNA ligase, partial [Burkholderiales bacterium]|nr:tyrosine--tRNA ligase [Burkholderiales bacterium]
RDVKIILAMELVARFHSTDHANHALADFELKFKHGGIPNDIPIVDIHTQDKMLISNLLKHANLVSSTSEGIRMIEQGGVKVDGDKISDKMLLLAPNAEYVIQVGKRKFAKIRMI